MEIWNLWKRQQLDQKEENNQGIGHKDNYPVGRTSNERSGASVSFPKPLVIIDMTLFETIVFYFLIFLCKVGMKQRFACDASYIQIIDKCGKGNLRQKSRRLSQKLFSYFYWNLNLPLCFVDMIQLFGDFVCLQPWSLLKCLTLIEI